MICCCLGCLKEVLEAGWRFFEDSLKIFWRFFEFLGAAWRFFWNFESFWKLFDDSLGILSDSRGLREFFQDSSRILSRFFQFLGTTWRSFPKLFGDSLGFFGILYNSLWFSVILWDSLGFFGILWDSLGFSGILWDSLGFSGIPWDSLGSLNGIWSIYEAETSSELTEDLSSGASRIQAAPLAANHCPIIGANWRKIDPYIRPPERVKPRQTEVPNDVIHSKKGNVERWGCVSVRGLRFQVALAGIILKLGGISVKRHQILWNNQVSVANVNISFYRA